MTFCADQMRIVDTALVFFVKINRHKVDKQLLVGEAGIAEHASDTVSSSVDNSSSRALFAANGRARQGLEVGYDRNKLNLLCCPNGRRSAS